MRYSLPVLIFSFSYLFYFVVSAGYAPVQSYFGILREESEEMKNYGKLELEGAVEMIYSVSLILQMKKLLPRGRMCWKNDENSGFHISFLKFIPNHTWSLRKTRLSPVAKLTCISKLVFSLTWFKDRMMKNHVLKIHGFYIDTIIIT